MAVAPLAQAKGNAAFAAGRHEEAIQHFTDGIAVDPSNHVLYSNRSASLVSIFCPHLLLHCSHQLCNSWAAQSLWPALMLLLVRGVAAMWPGLLVVFEE